MRRYPDKNYYAVLGVFSSASRDEIKRAYRRLVRTAHPDRGGDVEQFAVIAEAWEVLSDPERRDGYDLERRMQLRASRPAIRLPGEPEEPVSAEPAEPPPPRRERYSDEGISDAEQWKRHKRRF